MEGGGNDARVVTICEASGCSDMMGGFKVQGSSRGASGVGGTVDTHCG